MGLLRSAHPSPLGDTTRRIGASPGPPTSTLDPGGCPDAVPEARGLTSPALLESVDHWSLTIPETQIPGGSRPAESAVRRRCPRGLDPSPEGRMPQPASARKGV
ncbi:uncharacterized protein N7511_005069 [Penicillium nucicola]|uniref:uncharacterized protein n=1 Tax=Penicillium nucicola TaxID=1850975 RepID=UPI0025458221|nr:uncharacterized protein N7511_011570 [Penicillium nucicola]XP_056983990.1 uncharacterized protein N7511_005077 [Penicillium nucicola]XP_056983995.1 uncharacterized protein N7511_005090 [Penicillium nucicola]XP_056983997.1 uncharacterized protein N7511_005095 [Penicillium nucicola]XP_056984878.1 uncharacterized protein N7511_005040 [Penicillium nucicola]XP_056984880.1 uncharacterized protein N7511_005046 [Penicillium nucicola]XP_056984882.1 uncharacterized protein N7511_005052 [Penicillium 